MPQVDLSLGFTKVDKYPLYIGQGGNKGSSDITLTLNNEGLRGKGTVEYLSSITTSRDFIFYIDSMRTNSQSFNIEQNAMGKYPKVAGTYNQVQWHPYKDTMIIRQTSKPFYIYEKQIVFNGNLILTPSKLSSQGTFIYRNSDITSNKFIFTPTKLLADTATVKIKSDVENVYSFFAPKINLDLDVKNDYLIGEATQNDFKIQFPVNKYLTSQKRFAWDINKQVIELSKGKTQASHELYMLSTEKLQNGLQFNSLTSTYDLASFTLYAHKVPYIPVADARIYPDSNEVTVFKNAEMKSLANAEVKVDTIHFYHRIYNAYINVFGKYKYTGYGTYDYVDKNKKRQPLFFYLIRVDDSKRTIAKAKVADTAAFYLSPHFKYYGDIELNGNIKEMNYDGYVLPYHKIKSTRTTWFSYQNRINPDSIAFNLFDPKDPNARNLYTGVYMTADSPFVYNVFLGKLKTYSDPAISEIHKGVLYYDDKKEAFVFGDPDKVFNNEPRGSLFMLHDKTGDAFSEGMVDFGADLKALELRTAGQITFTSATNKYLFDLVMTMNFQFDQNALRKMTKVMIETAFNNKDTKEQRPVVKNAVAELVDNERERKYYMRQFNEGGVLTPEKALAKTFLFTDFQMTWDYKSKSFISFDNLVGINSINRTNISKVMDGGFQFAKRRSGIVVNFLLQPDPNDYYYFKYTYGIFSSLSSDNDFNTIVNNSANKFSQSKFRIMQASVRDLNQFKNLLKIK
jgi:hypothetical protein